MMYRNVCVILFAVIGIDLALQLEAVATPKIDRPFSDDTAKILSIHRRAAQDHHSMMHNHLSRKVFDRACAASKDTIDEIVACLSGNQILKTVDKQLASGCYKEAYGVEFDPKEMAQHKELICNNRDKFESMTSCVYRKTAESVDQKELEKLTEAMVDVGLCIINALDG